jgi:hypothetical protein
MKVEQGQPYLERVQWISWLDSAHGSRLCGSARFSECRGGTFGDFVFPSGLITPIISALDNMHDLLMSG